MSAHVEPSATPSEALFTPCLIGAQSDDRVAYELGANFRLTSYAFAGVGLLDLMIALVVLRRAPQALRVALLTSAVLLIGAGAAMHAYQRQYPPFDVASTHEHADLAIIIDGTPVDLTANRYQSEEGHVLSDVTHMHEGNGKIVHKHALGVTWGYFLHTIGLPLQGSCMTIPDGTQRCADAQKHWTMFVNGAPVENVRDLEIHDLDRVLMVYGEDSPEALTAQFDTLVSDEACITSRKCPERGTPPQESCGA